MPELGRFSAIIREFIYIEIVKGCDNGCKDAYIPC